MAHPVLSGLFTPDDTSAGHRRLLAGLGVVAAALALSVVADWPALLLLGLACVGLTGYALFAADQRLLLRFIVINGVAMLLLTWATTERAELLIQRTPDQLEVTLNGVRLAASTSGVNSPLNRVTVRLSAVEERPVAAPWVFDRLPLVQGFGEWLVGGMRGGVDTLRVIDANDSDLVPPIEGVWQPDHVDGPPRLSGSVDAWTVGRATDGSVTLQSPEIFVNRYTIQTNVARPTGQVTVTLGSEQPGANLDVVAAPDRRLFVLIARPADGPPETLVGGPFVFRRSVIGWIQTILRELGRIWLVALALMALARALALPGRLSMPAIPPALTWLGSGAAALVLGVGGLALAGLISVTLLEGIPHTVESIAYLFQAEVIAAGGLFAQAPLLPEFFEQPYVAATSDGRWFGVLPPGQSMLLAAGFQYGAHWLVSPLAAGLAIALTVVLGRATYGLAVGILAGTLLLFSPFVMLLAGDMLAHPAALVLVLLMTLGVIMALRAARTWQETLGWLVAGLALGGLVLTRPLAAGGIGAPLMLVLVFSSRGGPGQSIRPLVVRAAIFGLAASPGVFYAGYVNQALAGNPFLPPISLWSEVDRIGFGQNVGTRGGHDLANALGNTWANLAVLLRHLYGWPSYLTLAFALVPFVLGSTSRWDWLLLLSAAGLAAAHMLYWSDGIIYGPRFTFEAVAALALLTARGMALLARGDGTAPADETALSTSLNTRHDFVTRCDDRAAVDSESSAHPAADAPAPGLTGLPLVVTLVIILFAVNIVGYVPDLALAYTNYNGISRQNLQIVDQAGLENAVVFVSSDWPNWQAYGSVFPANSPQLDRGIIFARDLGEIENWRLMTRYAEQRWWLLRDGQLTELRP